LGRITVQKTIIVNYALTKTHSDQQIFDDVIEVCI